MSEAPEFIGFRRPSFTQTPNELYDELLPTISHEELKVLLICVRKTFGWQKELDAIAISQFQELTGLSKTGVARGLKGLQERRIIIAHRQSSRERGNEPTQYHLNILGDPCPKCGTSLSNPLSQIRDTQNKEQQTGDIGALWENVLAELRHTMNDANFETYFGSTFLTSYDGQQAIVAAPNHFQASYLQERASQLVLKAFRDSNLNAERVFFVVDQSA